MAFNPYRNYKKIKEQEQEKQEEIKRKEREKELNRLKSQPWLSLLGLSFKEDGDVSLLHQMVDWNNRNVKHSEIEEIPVSEFWDWEQKHLEYFLDIEKISNIEIHPLRTHKVMDIKIKEEGEYKDWKSINYFVQTCHGGNKKYAEEINAYLKEMGKKYPLAKAGVKLPELAREMLGHENTPIPQNECGKLEKLRKLELSSGYITSTDKLLKALDDLSEIDTYESSKKNKVVKYLSDTYSCLGTKDYSVYGFSETYDISEDKSIKTGMFNMDVHIRNRAAMEIYHSTNEIATALNLLLRAIDGQDIKALFMSERDCILYNSRVDNYTTSRLYNCKQLKMDILKCPFDILFHQKVRYIIKDKGHSKPLSKEEKQKVLDKVYSTLSKLKERLGGDEEVLNALMTNAWFTEINYPKEEITYKNKTFINCAFLRKFNFKFVNCSFESCYIANEEDKGIFENCKFENCNFIKGTNASEQMLIDLRNRNNVGTSRKTYSYFAGNEPEILAVHKIKPESYSGFVQKQQLFEEVEPDLRKGPGKWWRDED